MCGLNSSAVSLVPALKFLTASCKGFWWMHIDERIRVAVKQFLESKYGGLEIELTRLYARDGEVEVAGSFRRVGEHRVRRFTVLLDSNTLNVKAFGTR
jgi:hypothetical protein